ncbi:unnamed protein product, partial [Brenthis ino]
MNGRLCYCNSQGTWTEMNCKDIAQNQHCQPGQIIWQGCKQCVCQANIQLLCTNVFCHSDARKASMQSAFLEYGSKCLPFQTYYVNCSLCLCPASGQPLDAQCVPDPSCPLEPYNIDIVTLFKRNHCMSKVIYLFPCIQCICSETGFFVPDKCIQRCLPQNQSVSKCKPGSLYKNDRKVCKCPDSGIRDNKLCVKSEHTNDSRNTNLNVLRSPAIRCNPGTFTKPKCLFCGCNSEDTIDDGTCLELNCTTASNLMYYNSQSGVCNPGELVPICLECFCLSHGFSNQTYCTSTCTYENKIRILENVFSKRLIDPNIIDKAKIKGINTNDSCNSNTVYFNDGRYCLCSGDGNVELYCTSILENPTLQAKYSENRNKVDLNKSCEPNTLVDIDCNTCYCSKNGKIDPKWCTYDDCEAKRLVVESHKSHNVHDSIEESTGVCTPGSISTVKCNFCICPESGVLKERACTKNSCYDYIDVTDSKLTCEPLAYYEVDCNICYCPRDGLKNVDKCTKNQCEKSFLRSTTCVPGNLFSDDCNVCVCPPNGDKADKVCTNHTCRVPSWSAFKLSESLLDNQVKDESKRSLDLCFPGEEFAMGCNLCVCSELGLKTYANCEPMLCDDDRESQNRNLSLDNDRENEEKTISTHFLNKSRHPRTRRDLHDSCLLYNVSRSSERKECTPGSMYIIRPLPKDVYCEKAFPEFDYLPMGRRHVNNSALQTESKNRTRKHVTIKVKHTSHTTYKCEKPGNIEDECFICESPLLWLNNNFNLKCQPNKVYKTSDGNCLCTEKGNWPNERCRLYFQDQHTKLDCEPNKYVIIDCNICRCGVDGKIDKNQCTKHLCSTQRSRKSNTNGDCEPNMWYSLSPCRLCYCVNKHKLICNHNDGSPKVNIGKYEANSCGKMLLNDLKDLVPIEYKKLNVRDNKHKISKKKKSKNYSVEKRGKSSKKSKRNKKTWINNKDKDSNSVGVASTISNDKNDKIYDTNYLYNIKNNPKHTDFGSDIFISKEINWSDESSKINKRDKLELKFPDFLSLVMRKSMVSLDSGTHCKPGTTTKVECNMCYCLVNDRMLCTKNAC